MFNASGVIPTRFLTLIAHLCVLINLLWSIKETSSMFCHHYNHMYPYQHQAQLQQIQQAQQTQLMVGLSVALGLIAFEMLVFLSGITMFHSTSSLVSIIGHGSATILLTYFILDGWHCGWYWWIFGAFSCVPALIDCYALIENLCFSQ